MKIFYTAFIIIIASTSGTAQSGWEKNSKGHSVYVYRPSATTSTPSANTKTIKIKGVNNSTKVITPPEDGQQLYISSVPDANGMLMRRSYGKWSLTNEYGVAIFTGSFDNLVIATDGCYAASLFGKWGFIDKTGKTVVAFQYDERPYILSKGGASVVKDGKSFTINMKGETINEKNEVIAAPVSITATNDAKLKLAEYLYVGEPNADGSRLVTANGITTSHGTEFFSGLIDVNNNLVIPVLYTFIAPRINGMYQVSSSPAGEKNVKYGVVNEAGKEVIPVEYDYISDFDDTGHANALKGKKKYILDKQGNVEKL